MKIEKGEIKAKIKLSEPIDKIALLIDSKKMVVETSIGLFVVPDLGVSLSEVFEIFDFERPRGFVELEVDLSSGWYINADESISTISDGNVVVSSLVDVSKQIRLGMWSSLDSNALIGSKSPWIIEAFLLDSNEKGLAVVSDSMDRDFIRSKICLIDFRNKSLDVLNDFEDFEGFSILWAEKLMSYLFIPESSGDVYSVNKDGDGARLVFAVNESEALDYSVPALTPNGDALYCLSVDGEDKYSVQLRSIIDGGIKENLLLEDGEWPVLAFDKDSFRFAALHLEAYKQTLKVYNLFGALLAEWALPPSWVVEELVWSSDGRTVYFSTPNYLHIWQIPSDKILTTISKE